MTWRNLAFVCLALTCACSDDKGSGDTGGDGGAPTGGGNDASNATSGDTSGDNTSGGANGAASSGNGGNTAGSNTTGGNNDECSTTLTAIVRDFRFAHPDFENDPFMFESNSRNDAPLTGIVEATLGADKKPVYASTGPTGQTTGPAEFAQWYNDTPDINMAFERQIELTVNGAGLYAFDSDFFFPIDGEGFGNEGQDVNGQAHNFAFTTEIHTRFEYNGGEVFTFNGDDDLWLFINGKLAIDLGGLHPKTLATIDLDAEASALGIAPGNVYDMDIFHAERHTEASTFHIETSIGCLLIPI